MLGLLLDDLHLGALQRLHAAARRRIARVLRRAEPPDRLALRLRRRPRISAPCAAPPAACALPRRAASCAPSRAATAPCATPRRVCS